MKILKIHDSEGKKYSQISGDTNKIHTNDIIGYNSIFGEKICHGTLVTNKILSLINLQKIIKNKKRFNLNIKFINFVKYNSEISIIKRGKVYNAFQEKRKILTIELNFKASNLKYTKNQRFEKKIIIKKKENFFLRSKQKNISRLLNVISKYVGTVYPGPFSIIKEINVSCDLKLNINNNYISIKSKKIDKRFPIIANELIYKNFKIEFQSIIRPSVQKNREIIPNYIRKEIKKVKYNALIIGASQGVGYDVFNILNQNKKITKIATYNVNKIKKLNNQTIPLKFDVFKDLNLIKKIIKRYKPLRIFYFASPKIFFDRELSQKLIKKYKYIFEIAPLKILANCKYKDVSFFYPSTTNILKDSKSCYSKIKKSAELKLSSLCLKNQISIDIIRLPALNSRQSISVINPRPPSLITFLKSNPKIFNKIF